LRPKRIAALLSLAGLPPSMLYGRGVQRITGIRLEPPGVPANPAFQPHPGVQGILHTGFFLLTLPIVPAMPRRRPLSRNPIVVKHRVLSILSSIIKLGRLN